MITLGSITRTFNQMKKNGVNVKKQLLWGFFFTDLSTDKLHQVSKKLEKENYFVVDIYQDETKIYWLHVEQVAVHSPLTLYLLCRKFYRFARQNKLQSFDGYDVGNVNRNESITNINYN